MNPGDSCCTCDLQTADVLKRHTNLALHIHTASLKHTHTHAQNQTDADLVVA